MALKANPRPDIIFFMTDGQRVDEMGWIDIITQENHRMGSGAIIHTSVMMETDAAADMDRLVPLQRRHLQRRPQRRHRHARR